jgi:hypothetical protein
VYHHSSIVCREIPIQVVLGVDIKPRKNTKLRTLNGDSTAFKFEGFKIVIT